MGRTVKDLMTGDVISVHEDTPFVDIVRALEEHRISAVPVVDADHRVLGIVTQTDLLAKQQFRDEPPVLLGGVRHRREHAKAAAVDARGLMTAPAITVSSGTRAVEAARMLARHKIKQMPVVDGVGRLTGILARVDLLRVFLRSDEEIRREVIDEVLIRSLWHDPATVHVHVHDGRVRLTGRLELKSLIPIVTRLTESIDGVVDVTAGLSYAHDDTRPTVYPRA